ncbi:hypothetical protein [uncultured Clostridium sp.]|uniref:hypothetical protein n=1 Tax=uncultured Clostridium sp. TaxID=59620 RepID=UPI0025E3F717|nr:hypothetical protein [uncultured Clostridium sp.]
MKDYLTVLKIYHISILIISFMDFLIFLKILPSSLFLFLVILAVGASCGLSIYIKKNKAEAAKNNTRKTDMIVTIIWLVSMFAAISV